MDRGADVLGRRVAQDLHLAGLRVDLDVDDVCREGGARGGRRGVGADLDQAATGLQLTGDLLERELLGVQAAQHGVVAVGDLVHVAFPDRRRALLELAPQLHRRLVDGPAAGERGAATDRGQRVANRVGVHDLRDHVVEGDAHRLGELHRQRGAAAADVGRADVQADPPVGVDRRERSRLHPGVKPEARRDPSAAVGAAELGAEVIEVANSLEAGDVADRTERRAVHAAVALDHCVLQPELHRVDVELASEVVDHGIDGPLRGRGAGRAVRLHARLVDDDVPADAAERVQLVRPGGAHGAC